MSPLRPPTAARRPGFALAAVLVSCSAAHGQLAASSTGIALGEAGVSVCGRVSGSGKAAEVSAGEPLAGLAAGSASFSLEAGALSAEYVPLPGPPLLLAVAPASGPAGGGAQVELFGLNLSGLGIDTLGTTFGGFSATGLVENSATHLTLTSPAGLAPTGNPLGPAAVTVLTSEGFTFLEQAYVYEPGLRQTCPAVIGEAFEIQAFAGEPGRNTLLVGLSIPGLVLPTPPICGALDLVGFFAILDALPTSGGSESFSIAVPGMPSLVGKSADFQAIASPVLGTPCYSNRLAVQVQAP